MSRITSTAPRGLATRLALRYAKRAYRQVPEPLEVWSSNRGVFWTWSVAESLVARTWKALPPSIASLVELRAASVIGCPWCLDFGSLLARHAGVTEAQLSDLHRWADSDAFNDAESLALVYADAMTNTPMTVTDELVEQLREHFDDAQLVELTAFVALENQRSRFNHALGITSQGFTTGACALAATPANRTLAQRGSLA
jgi:AhpD family alkylhydroperoxidase